MMATWLPRIVILGLLAMVLGVPLAMDRSRPPEPEFAGDPSLRLILITPHNEQIRHEFAEAFNHWRSLEKQPAIRFDWRSGGGTSDLRRMIVDEFAAKARDRMEDQGVGIDLFFGGGDYEHNQLASGIPTTRDGREVRIPITTPIAIPDELLREVFPEPTIGGEMLYHPRLSWVGAALSSFGIVYNRDALRLLNRPEPTTWADLQDGRYRGWIALADPGHSGSIAATYNVILRRMGWTEGWALLRRMSANARYFTNSSSQVPVDVSAGEAAAGMCIDFYGRYQAGAIGGNRVGYVDPPYMTAITADPISILRGCPHPQIAQQFVAWLLSKDAQALWQRHAGIPGGPKQFELRRLPVRRDLYTPREQAKWADPDSNPFAIAKPLPPDMPSFYDAVAPVAHAMTIDVHGDLTAAWKAMTELPDHPRHAEMTRLFDAMPDPLALTWPDAEMAGNWAACMADAKHPRHAEAAAILKQFTKQLSQRWKDRDQQLRDRLEWTLFFRENYRKIVRIATGAGEKS
ncbi:MAG: extracellular solute-binding protein [Phycisphaeraceae bacterium]|nr:extracellular solute-binding protein [Phycisphaeraceae bacterium]